MFLLLIFACVYFIIFDQIVKFVFPDFTYAYESLQFQIRSLKKLELIDIIFRTYGIIHSIAMTTLSMMLILPNESFTDTPPPWWWEIALGFSVAYFAYDLLASYKYPELGKITSRTVRIHHVITIILILLYGEAYSYIVAFIYLSEVSNIFINIGQMMQKIAYTDNLAFSVIEVCVNISFLVCRLLNFTYLTILCVNHYRNVTLSLLCLAGLSSAVYSFVSSAGTSCIGQRN